MYALAIPINGNLLVKIGRRVFDSRLASSRFTNGKAPFLVDILSIVGLHLRQTGPIVTVRDSCYLLFVFNKLNRTSGIIQVIKTVLISAGHIKPHHRYTDVYIRSMHIRFKEPTDWVQLLVEEFIVYLNISIRNGRQHTTLFCSTILFYILFYKKILYNGYFCHINN